MGDANWMVNVDHLSFDALGAFGNANLVCRSITGRCWFVNVSVGRHTFSDFMKEICQGKSLMCVPKYPFSLLVGTRWDHFVLDSLNPGLLRRQISVPSSPRCLERD